MDNTVEALINHTPSIACQRYAIQMSVSAWGDSTSKRSNLQESVTIFWFRVLGRALSALEGVWFIRASTVRKLQSIAMLY